MKTEQLQRIEDSEERDDYGRRSATRPSPRMLTSWLSMTETSSLREGLQHGPILESF